MWNMLNENGRIDSWQHFPKHWKESSQSGTVFEIMWSYEELGFDWLSIKQLIMKRDVGTGGGALGASALKILQ